MLDWLTRRFQQRDWQLKPLHRLLMTSSTYRQSATRLAPETALRLDPENRWLWKMPVRRLQAEQIRDAMLVASGELDWTAGGPGVDADSPRRSIYTKVIRNRRDPLLDAFDGVDNFSSTAERNVTTTPTQALLLINGPFALARAAQIASHVRTVDGDVERISAAYARVLSRSPTSAEMELLIPLFASATDRDSAVVDLCHVLLNSSELIYLE